MADCRYPRPAALWQSILETCARHCDYVITRHPSPGRNWAAPNLPLINTGCRPTAVACGRQLSGKPKIIAAILEAPVIEAPSRTSDCTPAPPWVPARAQALPHAA